MGKEKLYTQQVMIGRTQSCKQKKKKKCYSGFVFVKYCSQCSETNYSLVQLGLRKCLSNSEQQLSSCYLLQSIPIFPYPSASVFPQKQVAEYSVEGHVPVVQLKQSRSQISCVCYLLNFVCHHLHSTITWQGGLNHIGH